MIKKTLKVSKMVDLEFWLINNLPINIKEEDLENLFIINGFSDLEVSYLLKAYKIPFYYLDLDLKTYDAITPKVDEIKFIEGLRLKYNVDKVDILNRIKDVRKINAYLKNNPQLNFLKAKIYNKLVRDNILNIISSDNEIPIYHIATEEEYWQYLLKKDTEELEELKNAKNKEEIKEELSDKLEILRAMAIHNGYTLEDIISCAGEKALEKGSFTRKIILDRTYKK